jgi:hypothetical protein
MTTDLHTLQTRVLALEAENTKLREFHAGYEEQITADLATLNADLSRLKLSAQNDADVIEAVGGVAVSLSEAQRTIRELRATVGVLLEEVDGHRCRYGPHLPRYMPSMAATDADPHVIAMRAANNNERGTTDA